jgi:hypothetical protein
MRQRTQPNRNQRSASLKPSDSTVDTNVMPISETRRRSSWVAAVGFLLISLGISAYAGLLNLFAVDAVAESRISASGPESWLGRPGAWQWDAMTALGVAAALLAGYMAAELLRRGRLRFFYPPAGWALCEAALVWFVWHASPNSGGVLALWQLAGAALLLAAAAGSPAEP